jgi:hypothetical protein
MGVTVVMAGGTLGDHPATFRIDDVEAGRQATAQLVGRARADRDDQFHRSLELEYAAPGARHARLHRALTEAGIEVRPELVVHRRWGSHGGVEGMQEFAQPPEPHDRGGGVLRRGRLRALRTLRRPACRCRTRSPSSASTYHHLADMFDLTTVHQPVAQQGLVAGQLVHRILQQGDVTSPHVTLPTHVVAGVRRAHHPADVRRGCRCRRCRRRCTPTRWQLRQAGADPQAAAHAVGCRTRSTKYEPVKVITVVQAANAQREAQSGAGGRGGEDRRHVRGLVPVPERPGQPLGGRRSRRRRS